jgi:ribonuclease III
MNDVDLCALQDRLGHRFEDADLLARALRHPSFRHEQDPALEDNDRLEFVGDAVLELWIRGRLYLAFPKASTGAMSAAADELVNRDALAALARTLDLGAQLALGKGAVAQGGRDNPSILSDALEAVLGAVYLDGGWPAADAALARLLSDHLSDLRVQEQGGAQPLQCLEQAVRERLGVEPTVEIVDREGPPHQPEFISEARAGDQVLGRGRGRGKKEARRAAAEDALARLAQGEPCDA